jgi:hypothetical protein
LLELLLLVFDADRPLSHAEIYDAIPAYRTTTPADEGKFERGKKDLRELGIPMEESQTKSMPIPSIGEPTGDRG